MSDIIEYIGRNYKAIENLTEISDNFFITKFYLCRLFKKHTGVSVIKYINTLKIQSACEELTETKKSIEEIALSSGFSTSMYFCKTFKSVTGMTPTQYRKNKKSESI